MIGGGYGNDILILVYSFLINYYSDKFNKK